MGLLDDIGSQVSSTFDDITSTGSPAIIAGIEQYGAQQLLGAAAQNQKAATQAAAAVLAKPGAPATGLLASIQGMFGSVGTSAALTQYGPEILMGVVGIGLVTYLLLKKG